MGRELMGLGKRDTEYDVSVLLPLGVVSVSPVRVMVNSAKLRG